MTDAPKPTQEFLADLKAKCAAAIKEYRHLLFYSGVVHTPAVKEFYYASREAMPLLIAEVERLSFLAAPEASYENLCSERDAAIAENARLRSALELAECMYRKNCVAEGEPSSVLDAIQAALQPKKD